MAALELAAAYEGALVATPDGPGRIVYDWLDPWITNRRVVLGHTVRNDESRQLRVFALVEITGRRAA